MARDGCSSRRRPSQQAPSPARRSWCRRSGYRVVRYRYVQSAHRLCDLCALAFYALTTSVFSCFVAPARRATPYRAWATAAAATYIVCTTLVALSLLLVDATRAQSLGGLALVLMGIPVYWLWRAVNPAPLDVVAPPPSTTDPACPLDRSQRRLGEGFGAYQLGDDRELLSLVTSANVACGFHAGDRSSCARPWKWPRLAVSRSARTRISRPDGFGRRELGATPREITAYLIYQIGALQAICRAAGTRLRYVKATVRSTTGLSPTPMRRGDRRGCARGRSRTHAPRPGWEPAAHRARAAGCAPRRRRSPIAPTP